jgi:hypothetical protein
MTVWPVRLIAVRSKYFFLFRLQVGYSAETTIPSRDLNPVPSKKAQVASPVQQEYLRITHRAGGGRRRSRMSRK